MKTRLLHVLSLASLMLLAGCGQSTTSSVASSSSAEETSSTASSVTETSSVASTSTKEEESSVVASSVQATTYEASTLVTVDVPSKGVTDYASVTMTGSTTGAATAFVAGETVTITATPIEKYTVADIIVALKDETAVETTASEGKYTFTMPEGAIDVEIEVVRTADYTLDASKLVESTDQKTISDETVTVYRKSDASDTAKTTVDGSTIKISGNTEFGNKLGKLVAFNATSAGHVYVKWKSGTSNETERCGYLIKPNSSSKIEKTYGYQNFTVKDDGKANWEESLFVVPAAGTYYLAGNASYAVGDLKLYYDSAYGEDDVPAFNEQGETLDELNGTYAIPTSDAGYASEHVIGNYTFGVGVTAKFYGKIDSTEPIVYSCFELEDGETMKFNASAAGTLSLRVTGRSGKDAAGEYPTSTLTAVNASGTAATITGIPETGMISSSKTKTWYNLSVQFTEAGAYTFTAGNVVDIYSANFAPIE